MSRTQPTDPALVTELARWRRGAPDRDALRLAGLATCRIRRTGRHHLHPGLLDALDHVHARLDGTDPRLAAFLDAVLARRHDRFRNQTYLALPLVELVRADLGVDHERMSALIIADVVRHELRPENAARLDPRTRATRIRHATRFVAAVDPALDVAQEPGGWFALTALPVSLEHDEYFFLRALQAHEMVFTTLTEHLRAATRALRSGDTRAATAHVTRAGELLGRAAILFRLVATMQPTAFHAFRQYTEGASAIQSEAYKRFELACGTPTLARLRSEAFDNVPAVRAEAPRLDGFTQAWRETRPGSAGLRRAVEQLEAGHQRWKTTHHSLAASMLGDAHGSGYTEGVPYLRGCLENRLFDLGSAEPVAPRCPMAA